MSKTIISTPNAPAAIGTYSQAVKVGYTVYLAGQIAVMGKGGRFTRLLENPWQGLPEPGGPDFEAFSHELRREILLAAGEEAAS